MVTKPSDWGFPIQQIVQQEADFNGPTTGVWMVSSMKCTIN